MQSFNSYPTENTVYVLPLQKPMCDCCKRNYRLCVVMELTTVWHGQMRAFISQCCLHRACLSSYCLQVGPALCTYFTVKLYSDMFSVPATTISTNIIDQNKNIAIRCLSGHAHTNGSVLKQMRNIAVCAWQDKTSSNSGGFGQWSPVTMVVAGNENVSKFSLTA